MSIRQWIVVIVLLVGVLIAMPPSGLLRAQQSAADPGLNGTYVSEGVNTDGEKYTGLVQIEQDGDVFNVLWASDAGVPSGIGFGLRTGDVLSVVFQTSNGVVSVVAYAIGKDGTLTGRWVAGINVTASERLTRSTRGPLAQPPTPAPPAADGTRLRV